MDRTTLRTLRDPRFLKDWTSIAVADVTATRQLLEEVADRLVATEASSQKTARIQILRDAVRLLNAANIGFICTLEREDLCEHFFSLGAAAGLSDTVVEGILEDRDW